MAKILLLVMCVSCWLWTTEGQSQSCTSGFPTLKEVVCSRRDEGSDDELRIIPGITFTCSGYITKWILSAQFRQAGDEFAHVQLQVWRFVNGESAVRMGSTTIIIHAENDSEIYEYRPEVPLRVEAGDVLGILQPNDPTLRVHEIEDGPTNYIVDLDNRPPPAAVTLASADDTNEALPLVIAEISISTTTSLRPSSIPHIPTATIPSPQPSQPSHPTTNGSATTSLRLWPIPHTLVSHTPTATISSPHPSQPSHPATNGSGGSDNKTVTIVGGVVGGVVLAALIASVMVSLVCIKKRIKMAESKEESENSTTTLRDNESLGYIHIHDNKAYAPTAILTHQNAAYGVPKDYITDDTQQTSIVDEGYEINQLLYDDIQSQYTLIGVSDLSYDYATVIY